MTQIPNGASPWREAAVELLRQAKQYFDKRTAGWLTASGKINLGAGAAGFTGVLPPKYGGTGTDTGAPKITYAPMVNSSGQIILTSTGHPIMVKVTL